MNTAKDRSGTAKRAGAALVEMREERFPFDKKKK